MTDMALFREIKPTWEMIGFDEDVPQVPHRVRRYHNDEFHQDAVYVCVIGDRLVYRRFEMDSYLERSDGIIHIFAMKPKKEIERYIFCKAGLFLERPDNTIGLIAPDKINTENLYDTLDDSDTYERRVIFREFIHKVVIPHKNEIVQALTRVRSYPQLGILPFIEAYSKATEVNEEVDDIPERIADDLYNRNLQSNTAIRIDKDLVVVTGEKRCMYLGSTEQTRAYFDSVGAYYFRQNAVTGRWQWDDSWKKQIRKGRYYFNETLCHDRLIDKEVFDNTFAAKFADSSVEKSIPNSQRINYIEMLAQIGFLSAEQAAKMNSPVYEVILRNIYEGKIEDGSRSLSELLGISGAQIKFLNDMDIPENLEEFANCINNETFKKHFPDIKKRIFAVSFYLGDKSWGRGNDDISEDEIIEARQTINSLESTDTERRAYLVHLYRDYIKMLRIYRVYRLCVNHAGYDDPFWEEVRKFGDFHINMKPSRIPDQHDKIIRVVSIIKSSDQILLFNNAIAKRKEEEANNIEYTNGTYSIIMPADASEIIREGRVLGHCVGSAGYIESMARKLCRILFLRKNEDISRPFITIEEKSGALMQCYGFRNSYNTDPNIRDFIKEYARLRDLRVDCVIYSER